MNAQLQDLKWYVAYTRPNSERKVAKSVADMGIESYLPLYEVIRLWSDRRKKMTVPLFPNYVFVRVNAFTRARLFSIKELIKFVSIERKPVVIREKEITMMKQILNEHVEAAPEEYLQEGSKVKIGYGQFAGLEGVIVRRCGKTRLVIRIDGLMKAFSFNISAANVAELVDVKMLV